MIDPEFLWPDHLIKLATVLEKVEQVVSEGGQINVAITMPPRHGKSETTSKKFPVWCLGKHPDWTIINTAYNTDLPESFSRYARDVIMDNVEFSRIFPKVKIDQSAYQVAHWKLDGHAKYAMIAAGVGGGITGYGGNIIIIDDPIKNRQEAESVATRENVWNWYSSTLRTRREPASAIILIMTRWHTDDLYGKIQKAFQDWELAKAEIGGDAPDFFETVHFPAVSDEEVPNPLWPTRFTIQMLGTTRATLGPYDWAALYLGQPYVGSGAIFKKEWFDTTIKPFELGVLESLNWCWSWDLALTTKESANYTVGLRWAFDKEQNFWLRSRIKLRLEAPQVRKLIKATLLETHEKQYVEQSFYQRALVQELQQDPELAGLQHLIIGVQVDKDKRSRALPAAARAEARMFMIADEAWAPRYVDVLCRFTGANDPDDDDVDATSTAFQVGGGKKIFKHINYLSLGMELSKPQPTSPPQPQIGRQTAAQRLMAQPGSLENAVQTPITTIENGKQVQWVEIGPNFRIKL